MAITKRRGSDKKLKRPIKASDNVKKRKQAAKWGSKYSKEQLEAMKAKLPKGSKKKIGKNTTKVEKQAILAGRALWALEHGTGKLGTKVKNQPTAPSGSQGGADSGGTGKSPGASEPKPKPAPRVPTRQPVVPRQKAKPSRHPSKSTPTRPMTIQHAIVRKKKPAGKNYRIGKGA